MAAGGFGSVLIVVKQPARSVLAHIGGIIGRKSLRVDTYQVVHPVAARERFIDEMIGVERFQVGSSRG
jgi:hypothetical protein